MDNFRKIGRRLSNWGKWGASDRIGTLNYISDQTRRAAAGLVRSGRLVDLGLEVGANGIQTGAGGRTNPLHLMSITPLDLKGRDDGLIVCDDHIHMPLQSVTQWDGLAHVGYDDRFYNDIPSSSVTTMGGSSELSIDQIASKGVLGRGVLLDIAALKGVDRLDAGYAITPPDLEAAETRQGVAVSEGDILLVRTGWLRHFTIDGDVAAYWRGEPGLDLSCAQWLHDRKVAALASDNWAVEAVRPDIADIRLPLHCVLIRDMGMTLGEIFVLDELAEACAAAAQWAFLLAAPPLKVRAGVGSPITPIALL